MGKGKFIQCVPAFVDHVTPSKVEFSTFEELTESEVVSRYKHEDFVEFVMSNKSNNNVLMAIYDDGYRWSVVGYISDFDCSEIKKWDGGKYRDSKK